MPRIDRPRGKLRVIEGVVPNPLSFPTGCRFHPRCEYAKEGVCTLKVPPLEELEPDHYVACVRAREIEAESPLRTENK
jgi:oligopeptide/dipeptide ABC transporter ATP-binding protein